MPAWITTSDWIFYTLSAILALSGVCLLYHALFKDRSKGKRRCPRCWYDMTGIPAVATASEANAWTCPECGRIAAREGQMLRTRRYWFSGVAGAALLALSYAAFMTPAVLNSDWTRFVPTTVLAVFADPDPFVYTATPRLAPFATRTFGPYAASTPASTWREKLSASMWARIESSSAFDWQARIFVNRVLAAQTFNLSSALDTPPAWPAGRSVPALPLTSSAMFSALGARATLLTLEVKAADGTWNPIRITRGLYGQPKETSHLLLPPPRVGERYRVECRLKLTRSAAAAILIQERTFELPLRGVATVSEVLTPVDDQGINDLVREARDPRLVYDYSGLYFAVSDRTDSALWRRIDFLGAVDFSIRCGDNVLATGTVGSWPYYPVWRGWRARPIEWMPGGEAIALSGAPLEVDFQGNLAASFELYADDPFTYPVSAWAGRFSCPLPIVLSPDPAEVRAIKAAREFSGEPPR